MLGWCATKSFIGTFLPYDKRDCTDKDPLMNVTGLDHGDVSNAKTVSSSFIC